MASNIPEASGGSRMIDFHAQIINQNINAVKQFAQRVRSAYGPNGMNKMISNHFKKRFHRHHSDAGDSTGLRELDAEHPAATLMVNMSKLHALDAGDGTKFVIIMAGALIEAAGELMRIGVSPSEINRAYDLAFAKSADILPELICHQIDDCKNIEAVVDALKPAIILKQYGNEEFIAGLVAKACVEVLPEKTRFNKDKVRIYKILGAGLLQSQVFSGLVFQKEVEGDFISASNAKIAIYSCPVYNTLITETKGTVLIESADELKAESLLEKQIKDIADTGVKVIFARAKFGDMAVDFLNKYGVMAVGLNSEFDLLWVARAFNGTVLPRLTTPTAEELGYCDAVRVDAVGDIRVVVFRMESKESRFSTIVIRGSSDNYLDDIERAIRDGVYTFSAIALDGRFVPGAGATEIELAHRLVQYADTLPAHERTIFKEFAVALESIPRALAENSGANATEVIKNIVKAHRENNKNAGFDIDSKNNGICDAKEKGVLDILIYKMFALMYASSAVSSILNIIQIPFPVCLSSSETLSKSRN